MNWFKFTNTAGHQWNILLCVVVIVIKYNKITIDNKIYIKLFPNGTVSYITASTVVS